VGSRGGGRAGQPRAAGREGLAPSGLWSEVERGPDAGWNGAARRRLCGAMGVVCVAPWAAAAARFWPCKKRDIIYIGDVKRAAAWGLGLL
jgi:hypothetical protein